jgi:D-hexose-6-phosphate mutarotase
VLKILLVGGAKDSKFDKISADLSAMCAKGNMRVQVVTANIYSQDVQAVEKAEQPDVILALGNKNISTQLPIIDGLPLMYPWMGTEKLLEEIAHHYGKTPPA